MTIVVMIICLVLITGKSFMKGMRNGGRKVYESARENNERYQEYRQYKSRERQDKRWLASDDTESDIKEAAKGGRRSKRAGRRMDNKITGVSLDTKIDGSEMRWIQAWQVVIQRMWGYLDKVQQLQMRLVR